VSAPSKTLVWAGRVLSFLPVFAMVMSAGMKFAKPPEVVKSFVGQFGYIESSLLIIGVVELLCAVLYVIPQTSVLGAILCTGYLGGAIATHVRIGDNFIPPLVLGILLWAGLWLRDPRLKALLPLRG
jgi:DoxX-like protein